MRVGDTVHNAIWLTGEEKPGMREAYEAQVKESIAALCDEKGFLHGPLRWAELKPGEDERVPEVPDHVQGVNVRLLVGEADVLCRKPQVNTRSFVGDLDQKDLLRLRQITRRAHARYNPGKPALTDAECDDWIERLGPDVALDGLRREMQAGTIH